MHARAAALSLAVAAVACAAAGAARSQSIAAGDTAAAAEWWGAAVVQEELEIGLDAAALAEMDDLLLDPVDLRRGDLDRLLVLPDLGPEHVAAVRAAPPATLAALAELPGWDGERARRVAPFVRFAAARGRTAPAAISTRGTRGVWRFDAAAGRSTWSARLPARFYRPQRPALDRIGGFARWDGARGRVVLGDVRLACAQGLLLWTGTAAPRAGTAPWRRARGLVGTSAAPGGRTVRGGGVAIRAGAAGVQAVAGRQDGEPVAAGTAAWSPRDAATLSAGVLRRGRRAAVGFGGEIGGPARHAGFEVALDGRGLAAAAAFETRGPRTRLAARVEARTPRDATADLAAVPSSLAPASARHALALVSHTWRDVGVDVGFAHGAGRRAGGESQADREVRVAAHGAAGARLRFEVIARWRATQEEKVVVEDVGPVQRTTARAFDARLRRTMAPGWAVAAALRQRSTAGGADSMVTGRAWQLRCERATRRLQVHGVLTTFRVPPGAGTLGDPGPETVPNAPSLRGEGLRLGTALRWRTRRCDARLGAGVECRAREAPRSMAGASWTLRWP
jgi:hypothetical protein